ncbi:hypothetical protein CLW00_107231 [Mongoliibacter ruber]|uniref:Uncharacterized protein n=1 Tax=Mongoliibacter ruber TaxID=1750599 RepID=A0A2T0WKC7_9BACT|nr:hypothetical protein CLW00_107231 [Mongoliibacter ruber]
MDIIPQITKIKFNNTSYKISKTLSFKAVLAFFN